MIHMGKSLLGLIVLFLSLAGSCALIPCSWDADLDALEKTPQADFLVGAYMLDERTLNYVPGYENAQNAVLNLNPDGTFEMRNVPKGTFDFMGYYDEMNVTVDAKGTWKVGYGKGTAELNVSVEFDSTLTDLSNFWTSWRIYEKDKKPIVFIMVGDPDECAAVRFEPKK